MPQFRVLFVLDEEPTKQVAEYVIETQWEEDAMAQAHERWTVEFPEDSQKPFTSACGNA